MTESHWKRRMEISFHLLTFINAAASKHQLKAHYFFSYNVRNSITNFLEESRYNFESDADKFKAP